MIAPVGVVAPRMTSDTRAEHHEPAAERPEGAGDVRRRHHRGGDHHREAHRHRVGRRAGGQERLPACSVAGRRGSMRSTAVARSRPTRGEQQVAGDVDPPPGDRQSRSRHGPVEQRPARTSQTTSRKVGRLLASSMSASSNCVGGSADATSPVMPSDAVISRRTSVARRARGRCRVDEYSRSRRGRDHMDVLEGTDGIRPRSTSSTAVPVHLSMIAAAGRREGLPAGLRRGGELVERKGLGEQEPLGVPALQAAQVARAARRSRPPPPWSGGRGRRRWR